MTTSPLVLRTEFTRTGERCTPPLAKTVYADVMSSGVASYAPRAIAGVAFTDVIPAALARSATLS